MAENRGFFGDCGLTLYDLRFKMPPILMGGRLGRMGWTVSKEGAIR